MQMFMKTCGEEEQFKCVQLRPFCNGPQCAFWEKSNENSRPIKVQRSKSLYIGLLEGLKFN